MLILTRRSSERIMVGPDIVITIIEVRGQQCRIGIDAPKDVHIVREELLQRDARKAAS